VTAKGFQGAMNKATRRAEMLDVGKRYLAMAIADGYVTTTDVCRITGVEELSREMAKMVRWLTDEDASPPPETPQPLVRTGPGGDYVRDHFSGRETEAAR